MHLVSKAEELRTKTASSQVAKGVSSEKIIVGGFSQGGTVALRAALKFGKRLGGVVMLNSFVGPIDDLAGEGSEVNATV